MVTGLAQFRAHFGSFNDKYVLIGGTACSIALEEADLKFNMRRFLDAMKREKSIDLQAFGLKRTSLSVVLENLRKVYGL